MGKTKLEIFMERISGDGAWVLAEASPTMQLYVRKHYPDEYEKEILKYMTPQKYIKRGDKIIVVSLTEQIWGGIKIFDEEDIIFKEIDGMIHSIQNKKRAKVVLSAVDFQETVGEKTLEEGGVIVKIDQYQTKKEFKEKMLASGYLTGEEFEYYTNPENFKNMIRIKTVNF